MILLGRKKIFPPNGMCSSQTRLLRTTGFKLMVNKYAKEHGDSAAKRHVFRPPPAEKMIQERKKAYMYYKMA
jgi:hypothetical protein